MPDCVMPVGNAVAMRSALGTVLRYLQWLYAQGCTDRGRLSDEIDRVVSAISEPPRNCDRFGTVEEADGAYRRFREREIAKIPIDALDYSGEVAKVPRRDRWLFMPAAEKGDEE